MTYAVVDFMVLPLHIVQNWFDKIMTCHDMSPNVTMLRILASYEAKIAFGDFSRQNHIVYHMS